jgi:ABC-type antimicrobial peptide transport system permease subunit
VGIRTMSEPFSLLNRARVAVESLDRDLPLIEPRTQEQQIAATLSSERVFAQLTSIFGLVALALASIGVYGLMAYTVARRTQEIGIRMALGARAEQVLTAVVREALWLALAGLTLGIGASFWLARFVGSLLYGLKSSDPLTMAGTTLLLLCVTLLAGIGPARRASRVDPLRALRHE